ncbi:hypothetical protein ACVWW9_002784 [Agrococcus sp. UYP33]
MSARVLELGRWHATDALRLVILASIPLAWLIAGPPSAAAMLLVLGGSMLTRIAPVSSAVDVTTQAVLLAAAWCATLGLYETVPALDLVAHVASGAVLALLARALLLQAGLLPGGDGGRAAAARMLHVVSGVALLGLLWELGEWAGNTFITTAIRVGYADTLSDLVADVVGAIVAVVVIELARRRRAS